MNKVSFAGAFKEPAGAVKQAFGNAIGDAKMQEAGRVEKAEGKAEKTAAKAEEAVAALDETESVGVSAAPDAPRPDNPSPLSSALHIPTLLNERKTPSQPAKP